MPADASPPTPDDAPTGTFGPDPARTGTFSAPAASTIEAPKGYTPPEPTDGLAPDGEPFPDGGRYQPERFHRKGGMGRVFRARDTELNREVALKGLQAQHACRPTAVRQFLFEAEVTGQLEHPGVVPVYGLGRGADGRPFYAMRFIEGESLKEAIAAFHAAGPAAALTTDRAVAFRRLLARFLTVCQAVAYAHSRGVIHRDLKPQNVMLGPFGETLVVDWGLAKRVRGRGPAEPSAVAESVDDVREATRTAPGTAVGTPAYWSPEQAEGRPDDHDERTDVYGLGAILFEIVTGRPPHPDGRHASTAPMAKGQGVPIDDELNEIIQTALCPDPATRPTSAGDLALSIERWLADQPVAAQRTVVQALERELERNPDQPDLREQLARQQINLGLMYSSLGRPLRAARAFTYAARWYEAEATAGRARPRDRAELANCRLHLAHAFDALGLPEQAIEERTAAAEMYRGLIAAYPGEYKANYATIIITRNLPPGPPAAGEPPSQQTEDVIPDMLAEPLGEPELVEGYTVLRVLGQGGAGRILLARDNALNRRVAIKEFSREFTGVEGRRFLREMQATANLQHPNIVTVYTYGLHAGTNRPFLVMEYVEGRTLAEEARAFHAGWGTLTEEADSLYARRIARPNPEFTRLLNGFAQACDAIHYAHTQRIVHRDPKPANILLREDGMAKLIDFGLVKLLGGRDESSDSAGLDDRGPFDASLTLTGAVLGTPAFMSPEQARNPANVTTSSDIYVLGAGLFFILTGRPPLVGNTMVEVLSQLVDGRIPRPRAVLPHVPVELDDLCARAMAFRPEDRYPSAAALAADIRNWLARGSADSRPPSPVSEPSIPTGTSSHMPPVLRSPAERPTWRASDTPEVRSSRNVSWLPLVSVALTFLVIGVAIAYWLVPMLARLWQ